MPTYFDPIMLEDTLLDEKTNVYLVKSGDNKFSIKAISSGLERLPSDPTTHATEYWPISVNTLISLSSNKILFEDDKLTTKPLTNEQVKELFNFDPNEVPPTEFDSSIKQELTDEWSEQVMQDEFAHSGLNPHSFFFQPIFLHAHHQNNNPDVEHDPHSIIPAILLFQLMPGSANNEEEGAVPVPLVISMLMLVPNLEEHQEEEEEEEEEENNTNNLP